MTAPASLSQSIISDSNELYFENFYLNIDKLSLEIEIERLKLQLDMYKSLAKEYQQLYFAKI